MERLRSQQGHERFKERCDEPPNTRTGCVKKRNDGVNSSQTTYFCAVLLRVVGRKGSVQEKKCGRLGQAKQFHTVCASSPTAVAFNLPQALVARLGQAQVNAAHPGTHAAKRHKHGFPLSSISRQCGKISHIGFVRLVGQRHSAQASCMSSSGRGVPRYMSSSPNHDKSDLHPIRSAWGWSRGWTA